MGAAARGDFGDRRGGRDVDLDARAQALTWGSALGANTIVTSLEEEGRDTRRIELPGIVDFEASPALGNDFTSQSAPYFIGQALQSAVSEREARQALAEYNR